MLFLSLAMPAGVGSAFGAENRVTNWVDEVLSRSLASPTNRPGFEVVGTKGTVERRPQGSSGELRVGIPQTLTAGERLSTRAYSQAAAIHPRQALGLDQLGRVEILPTGIKALEGRVFVKSLGSTDGNLWVSTPQGQVRLSGTEVLINIDPSSGTTEVSVGAGRIDITGAVGDPVAVLPRQIGVLAAGQPPQTKNALVGFGRSLRSLLLYPPVLDLRDLGGVPGGESMMHDTALAASLAAYRRGDVLSAHQSYPAGRLPGSEAERLYVAAVGLSVGGVEQLEQLLAPLRGANPAANGPTQAGRLAAALERTTRAVQGEALPAAFAPATATEWLAESYDLFWRSAYGPALDAAREAVRLNPDFGFGHGWLAELEFRFGKVTRAEGALAEAFHETPDNAQALALQGFLHGRNHRREEAYRAFEQAASIEPRSGNAWLGLGLYHACAGNPAKAVRCLQIAASLEPQRALLRSYLARAYAAAARSRTAREQLELSARDARVRSKEERERARELDPGGAAREAWILRPVCLDRRGFYVGLDAGLALVQAVTAHSLVLDSDCELSPADEITFDPGARLDLTVGYRLSRQWRVELEGGLIWNRVATFLGATSGRTYQHVGAEQSVVVHAGHPELYQVPVLANVVYEFPIKGRFSGQVGLGLGLVVGDLHMDGTTVECYNDEDYLETRWHHSTDVVFACQGMVKVRYALSDRLSVGLSYKLLGTTEYTWHEGAGELNTDGTLTHAISGDLTYAF